MGLLKVVVGCARRPELNHVSSLALTPCVCLPTPEPAWGWTRYFRALEALKRGWLGPPGCRPFPWLLCKANLSAASAGAPACFTPLQRQSFRVVQALSWTILGIIMGSKGGCRTEHRPRLVMERGSASLLARGNSNPWCCNLMSKPNTALTTTYLPLESTGL